MKKIFDLDINNNIQPNSYTRTSRSNSRIKNDFVYPISKIEDFQTSMSSFSTRIESKNRKCYSDNHIRQIKKKKLDKRKVEFNPLITVVNIESFKKENYEGNFDAEERCNEELFNNHSVKKCILCSIF